MRVGVSGIGTLAPGWTSWSGARAVLGGEQAYDAHVMPKPVPDLLPPAERRRAADAVRWTQAPALEALTQAGIAPNAAAAVFASSSGNPDVVHQICEALARPERDVSPTRFHHSVHNTAAGYWAIATGCRMSSTSLACYDASFAAGLLEAATQVVIEARPVLLVAYDLPYPQPLYAARPIPLPFAVAMVLSPPTQGGRVATLVIEPFGSAPPPQALPQPELEALRLANPAARALPLLHAIARGDAVRVDLDYAADYALALQVQPC